MRSVYFLLSLFCTSLLTAQNHSSCGIHQNHLALIQKRLQANLVTASNNTIESRNEIIYVPITFHLVANEKGLGRVKESNVLDQLCQLNTDFLSQNIQFFIKKFNYIDNGILFENHVDDKSSLTKARVNGALNVFILNNANNTTTIDDGITLGYFDPQQDWVIIKKSEINDRSPVLTHEIGHFFSLLHPYNGWDSEPWTLKDHGSPAPSRSPRGVATELADGSNCDRAGDFLCDTPADYFFSFGWESCNFTKNVLDPDGVKLDPDELNYMANFTKGCDRESYYFSEEQQTIIRTDLLSPTRNYLKNNFVPVELQEKDLLTFFPENDVTVPTFNQVDFEWSSVQGATKYLVEIDRVQSFNIRPIRITTEDTSLNLNSLDANRKYYWRVRPYNEYTTCTEFSEPMAFQTGETLDTSRLDLIEKWNLFPNPLNPSENINVEIETRRNFNAEIQIYNIVGKRVYKQQIYVNSLYNTFQFDTQTLSNGAYILVLTTEQGQLKEKFIITN